MDVDFSQLEVVALQILSGDSVLKDDLLSGKDMHVKRASELFGITTAAVTETQRQLAKALSFQLQYGAGYKSMAEKNKVSETLAKTFIQQYYERYSRVKEWQDEVMAAVKASRRNTGKHTVKGYPVGAGVWESETGRVYKFFEYESTYGRADTSFSPTEVKNYPVQGFATADIMALYRGMVYRRFLKESSDFNNNVKLINTVHDSVMLDVSTFEMVLYVYRLMEEVAEELPNKLYELWGIEVNVPFKVDGKAGPSWAELTPILLTASAITHSILGYTT